MGFVSGVQTNLRTFRCRKCGEPIRLELRSGFVVKGSPKRFAVNADDGQPHWKRCRLKVELKAAKEPKPERPADAGRGHYGQEELF